MCIWEGAVVAKFSFSHNSATHQLTLATANLPPYHRQDTTLLGYKIEFVNLHPYPTLHPPFPQGSTKAEVKVTRL